MKKNNVKKKDILKETKFYKKYIGKREEELKNLFKVFILKSVMIFFFSGFITIYILNKIKNNFMPIILDKNSYINTISSGNSFESFIILISVILLLCMPLVINFKTFTSKLKLGIMVVISIINIIAYIILISTATMNIFIKCVVYLTVSYLVWLVIDLLIYIYNWLWIPKEKTKQIDVAKLTFIWAIIVFLLNLIF